MKILITGAYGQLGRSINDLSGKYADWKFLFTDYDSLDITNEKAIAVYFNRHKPQFVINCAAYTAVDKAEIDKPAAQQLNSDAPAYLAKAAALSGAGFIHISTDYVFDGTNFRPYKETDQANPQTVYGHTKLLGEQHCLKENPDTIVIRTSWLYSLYGNNFVQTMLRLGRSGPEVRVVFDQVGTPTFAGDLAEAILLAVGKSSKEKNSVPGGVYHFSNEGVASWYDFAVAVFNLAQIDCKVQPLLTRDFPRPAKRPFYSVLDKEKIRNVLQMEIPHWQTSLKNCIIKTSK